MTVEAVLLGVAQDAGVPQLGCDCPNCRAARSEPATRQMAVSLGLVDHAAGASWIIDATPDFGDQYDWLRAYAPDCPLQGILLTHAHIGHYHTAGNPGRNELDESQELNYRAIAQAIAATGYTGYIGQEFIPTRDPVAGLRKAYEICRVAQQS